MSEDMQVRNLAPHTQRSYLQQVSQFARHFGKSPDLLGPDDIRAYQLHLTRDKHLSPQTWAPDLSASCAAPLSKKRSALSDRQESARNAVSKTV